MIHTEHKYRIEKNKIVIFGAGKIGRSFIGQLFGAGGYDIVFVDIDKEIIDLLNEKGCYRVISKGEEEKEILVRNVKAVSAGDKQIVAETVATASILSISVGKKAIEKVIPLIAWGLIIRNDKFPGIPVDIIIAENMISGAEFVKGKLIENLPSEFPVNRMVGLVETSIGKMVPIMTHSELEKDPLLVYAEPYNTLILDRRGFKTPIPDVAGLAPKDNIKAWVDRKAFIHNLGHAAAAYYGSFLHRDAIYIYEVLDDKKVLEFTGKVMMQAAEILLAAYPCDFTKADLEEHIADLLTRFRNRALRDTLYRVGHDLTRKLSSDDRFMGAVHLAGEFDKPSGMILEALSYGFVFKAVDDSGDCFPADLKFLHSLSEDFENTLINELHFDPVHESGIIYELKKKYEYLQGILAKSQ